MINQAAVSPLHEKWVRYGQPSQMYHKYPEFRQFLESSGLLSQMKVTHDTLQEIDGEPAILVEGKHMKWSTFKEQFEVVKASGFNDEKFIWDKTTHEIYTYLGNGKGLQLHHPYLTEHTPIAVLTKNEYAKVYNTAKAFVRKGEESLSQTQRTRGRPFVVQIVTSYVSGKNTRAHKLLQRSKHPYLRIIIGQDNPELGTKKGEVYEVGYGWKRKVTIPFVATQGQFRSPDVWEYMPCEERVVTSIPVSQKEANQLYRYTTGYHRDGINLGKKMGFHLAHQNCSTYARHALQAANIEVPTEVSLPELLKEIAPDWIRKIGAGIAVVFNKAIDKTSSCLPKSVKGILSTVQHLAHKVLSSMAALTLVPVRAATGGALGEGGQAFVAPGEKARKIVPALADPHSWYDLSSYRFNLPGVLQKWQRNQPSTIVYKNPIKLTIG